MNKNIVTRIQLWPIGRLVPYAANPRTHSAEQIDQIATSIAEFGFNNPILVDSSAGIVAGHARAEAARKMGLNELPVIVLDHLSETQKRAYIITDNQLALNAGWDDELLAKELAALEQDGFEMEKLGLPDEQLMALLEQDEECFTDPDAAPQIPAAPVTRPCDTWLLGPHRVHCGDATQEASFRRLLAGEHADMVFTDPPYNVAYNGSGRTIENDDLGGHFGEFLGKCCSNMLNAVEGAVYICMSSSELHTLYQAFTDAGGHWSTFIIWAKNTFTLGRSDYQRQFEPILYGWPEGRQHYWCGERNQGDVWFVDKPVVNDLHPTMKPVELVERAILNSSQRNQIVLDPFGGSGSTLIGAERTGRRARLLELDPRYVDVIVRRWQEFSRKSATHEADGRTFDAISDRLEVGK